MPDSTLFVQRLSLREDGFKNGCGFGFGSTFFKNRPWAFLEKNKNEERYFYFLRSGNFYRMNLSLMIGLP